MTQASAEESVDFGAVLDDRHAPERRLGEVGHVTAPARSCLALRRRDLEDTDDRGLVEVIRGADAGAAANARSVLTERYQPLVGGQSAQLHRGRGTAHEDVVSVAQHGLQKAIRDHDLGHGAPFAAYAKAKVRGELMRWFRDDRYSVHVPRPLHERFMQVRRAAAHLETVLHREPDVEEVAEHMDCSVAGIIEAWAVDSAERVRAYQLQDRLLATASPGMADLDLAGCARGAGRARPTAALPALLGGCLAA